MVEHVCPKCHKKFNRKDAYNIHVSRKNPCVKQKDTTDIEKLQLIVSEQKIQIQELTKKLDIVLAKIEHI